MNKIDIQNEAITIHFNIPLRNHSFIIAVTYTFETKKYELGLRFLGVNRDDRWSEIFDRFRIIGIVREFGFLRGKVLHQDMSITFSVSEDQVEDLLNIFKKEAEFSLIRVMSSNQQTAYENSLWEGGDLSEEKLIEMQDFCLVRSTKYSISRFLRLLIKIIQSRTSDELQETAYRMLMSFIKYCSSSSHKNRLSVCNYILDELEMMRPGRIHDISYQIFQELQGCEDTHISEYSFVITALTSLFSAEWLDGQCEFTSTFRNIDTRLHLSIAELQRFRQDPRIHEEIIEKRKQIRKLYSKMAEFSSSFYRKAALIGLCKDDILSCKLDIREKDISGEMLSRLHALLLQCQEQPYFDCLSLIYANIKALLAPEIITLPVVREFFSRTLEICSPEIQSLYRLRMWVLSIDTQEGRTAICRELQKWSSEDLMDEMLMKEIILPLKQFGGEPGVQEFFAEMGQGISEYHIFWLETLLTEAKISEEKMPRYLDSLGKTIENLAEKKQKGKWGLHNALFEPLWNFRENPIVKEFYDRYKPIVNQWSL